MSTTPLEVPTLFNLLLQSSWQAGLLVLLVVGVQRLLRGRLTPAWHHALWWTVLGRLLIPMPPASSWSLFNLLPTPPSQHTLPNGRIPEFSGWKALLTSSPSAPSDDDSPAASTPSEAGMATPTPFGTPAPAAGRVFPAMTLGGGLGFVWALVASFLLGRLALQGFRFSRRARACTRPAGPALLALLKGCRAEMGVGRQVELLQGDLVPSPAIFGILRPRLILPQQIAETYPPDRLRHVLLHELAHVRRGDLLVHGLTRVLQALHWFNPVLAWAFRRLRADREIAADALALEVTGAQESRAYGLTIVRLLQNWAIRPTHPGTVGILENGGALERRIRAIAHYRRPSRWAPAAGIVVAALAAASWTGAQPPPPGAAPPPAAADSTSTDGSSRPDTRPPGDFGSRTHAISLGRQRILSSLESIRIPEVGFDGLPLKVVVRQLKEMARTYDPKGTGMNFFINPHLHRAQSQEPQALLDPATGQPIQPLEPEPAPLGDVLVRIHPPLRDVRLIDVLLEVTRYADAPILFNVEAYAVVFAANPPQPKTLVTRVFRTNPDQIVSGLESTMAVRQVNAPASTEIPAASSPLQEKVRLFLQELGVSLVPPNALFFNDRLGLLMARCTPEEMRIIENAIEVLNEGTSPAGNIAPTAPKPPADTTGNVELLHRYAQAVASLDGLLTRYRAKWPAVIEARARVEALRAELAHGPVSTNAPSTQPAPLLASPSRPAPHILILSHDGLWTLNGHPLHPADRESQLRQALARQPAATAVLQVQSDPRASFGDVVKAMDLSKKVGFTNISVAPVLIPVGERALK